jgi:hypothetical protein
MHFLSFGALETGNINGEEPLGSILKYMQSACIVKHSHYSYELPSTKDQNTSVSSQNQEMYEVKSENKVPYFIATK